MRLGEVVFMSSWRDVMPKGWISYSAPKGTLAVFVLIGSIEKKEGAHFSVEEAMDKLGWRPKGDQP